MTHRFNNREIKKKTVNNTITQYPAEDVGITSNLLAESDSKGCDCS